MLSQALMETDDSYFEENEIDKFKVLEEMITLKEEGDNDKMRDYLDANESCNYYNESVESADEFILGRKTFFTGKGLVITGTKLEDL